MKLKHLLSLAALAPALAATAQTASHLSVTPAAHPGQTVELTYDPTGTKLEKQTDIKGVAYLFNKKQAIAAEDVTLTNSGGKWVGKLTIPDTTVLAAFKFSANKMTDDNGEKGYYTTVKGADNKPVQGAQLSEAFLYQYTGYLIGLKTDVRKAQQLYEAEFAAYPSSKKGTENMYYAVLTQNKDEAKKAIERPLILTAFNDKNATETELSMLSNAFYTSDRKLADSLSKQIIVRYPKGNAAMNSALMPIYREADPAKKVEMYQAVKANYTLSPAVSDNIVLGIASAYGAKKDYANFERYVGEVKDKRNLAGVFNSVAWPLAEAGTDLELAAKLSKQSLDIIESYRTNPPAYYSTMPPSQRAEQINGTYASYADTYGLILFKQGKLADALAYQEKAVDLAKGSSPEPNERLVTFLAANGNATGALKRAEEFIKDGKSTAKMKEELKGIYTKAKGSETGYATYLSGLEAVAYTKAREEVMKQMINQKSVGFALKDLDGKAVSLASLKGKVVVVDFWATWCGPCKASFPGMQKTVNKYKADPNVKFVFIDTWESDPKKEELVKKFIADNKYTFHVLYDTEKKAEKGKYDVVEAYGVDGIPTKFVLDKAGNVRFKAVGFNGSDDALVSELSMMIDLAAKPPQVTASLKE